MAVCEPSAYGSFRPKAGVSAHERRAFGTEPNALLLTLTADQPQQGRPMPQHASASQQDAARLVTALGEARAAVLDISSVAAMSIFFI